MSPRKQEFPLNLNCEHILFKLSIDKNIAKVLKSSAHGGLGSHNLQTLNSIYLYSITVATEAERVTKISVKNEKSSKVL